MVVEHILGADVESRTGFRKKCDFFSQKKKEGAAPHSVSSFFGSVVLGHSSCGPLATVCSRRLIIFQLDSYCKHDRSFPRQRRASRIERKLNHSVVREERKCEQITCFFKKHLKIKKTNTLCVPTCHVGFFFSLLLRLLILVVCVTRFFFFVNRIFFVHGI